MFIITLSKGEYATGNLPTYLRYSRRAGESWPWSHSCCSEPIQLLPTIHLTVPSPFTRIPSSFPSSPSHPPTQSYSYLPPSLLGIYTPSSLQVSKRIRSNSTSRHMAERCVTTLAESLRLLKAQLKIAWYVPLPRLKNMFNSSAGHIMRVHEDIFFLVLFVYGEGVIGLGFSFVFPFFFVLHFFSSSFSSFTFFFFFHFEQCSQCMHEVTHVVAVIFLSFWFPQNVQSMALL